MFVGKKGDRNDIKKTTSERNLDGFPFIVGHKPFVDAVNL